jgi:hypothetical protein
MNHPLQCRCGTLKGYISHPEAVSRCVCYCRDCQAFAHFLGRPAEVLDELGGTDVIQALPANVTFTDGQSSLACMRLTEKGLLRWYAKCCNTPVGNTMDNYRMSYIGLVHTCLQSAGASLDDSFGPVRMWVNTKNAKGEVKSNTLAMISGMLRIMARVARARIDGSYRFTPFFSADTGAPIVTPKVLSSSELQNALNAARLGPY